MSEEKMDVNALNQDIKDQLVEIKTDMKILNEKIDLEGVLAKLCNKIESLEQIVKNLPKQMDNKTKGDK